MRKTKIIATVGPATESVEMLREVIRGGLNIVRLNMSHAAHDWVRQVVSRIRAIAAEEKRHVGILLDTQGPAIRTGDLPAKISLKVGDSFTFTVRGYKSEESYSVDTNYDDLVNDIAVGDVVLVDNGVIHMLVKEKEAHQLKCEVLTAGELGSRRHINLPGVKVNLPAITEKDQQDIALGVELGVDFISLSFTREASDVRQLRDLLARHRADDIRIIAKIEDQLAVRNIHEIIDAADGIMIARGDLGIECPYEELPIIQRRIVGRCITAKKPVIVATHMLESMIVNPRPTRAEITDVSNAVYENADAIMLSGETTTGRYPKQCVEILHNVARRIERSGNLGFHRNIPVREELDCLISSAVHLADNNRAAGILVFTLAGRRAALCAAMRPRFAPIYAITSSPAVARQLSLNYGVEPWVQNFHPDIEEAIANAERLLLENNRVRPGDFLVVVADILARGQSVGSVQLRKVGELSR